MKVNRITEAFLRLFYKKPMVVPQGDWTTPSKKPTKGFEDIMNPPRPYKKYERTKPAQTHKNTAMRIIRMRKKYRFS